MDVQIPCICGHHDSDSVTLKEALGFREALAIRNEVILLQSEDPDTPTGEVIATLTEGYLLHGIEAWSLQDDKGKPVAVTRSAIRDRLLSNVLVASSVGEAADGLYSEAVMLPLLLAASKSSPHGRTGGSTSRPNGSGSHRPKPSKRSSTSTTRMVATEATGVPPAGAYRS